jgi:hypothetical protein
MVFMRSWASARSRQRQRSYSAIGCTVPVNSCLPGQVPASRAAWACGEMAPRPERSGYRQRLLTPLPGGAPRAQPCSPSACPARRSPPKTRARRSPPWLTRWRPPPGTPGCSARISPPRRPRTWRRPPPSVAGWPRSYPAARGNCGPCSGRRAIPVRVGGQVVGMRPSARTGWVFAVPGPGQPRGPDRRR